MAAHCWSPWCENQISHMLNEGHVHGNVGFSCDEHTTHPYDKRAVVLYLPINGQILMMSSPLSIKDPRFEIDTLLDYHLPGGKVERGETDWEAIVRETYEETGLDITDPIPLFAHTSFADTGRQVTAFTARLISSPFDLKGNGREGDPVWGPPDLLTLTYCTYREYNGTLLEKIGVQL